MALERRKCTRGDPFILDKRLEAWDREDKPTKPTDKENLYDQIQSSSRMQWYLCDGPQMVYLNELSP